MKRFFVNLRARLNDFKRYAKSRRPKDAIAQLITSDRYFQSDPYGAYAEAWMLTFYLVETQSGKFSRYLQRTSTRPNFSPYRGPDRLKDFTDIFGDNLALLNSRMIKFIVKLD